MVGDRNRVNVIENFSAFCSPPRPSFARSFFLPAISALSPRLKEKPKNYRGLTTNFIAPFFSPPPYTIFYTNRSAIFSIEKKLADTIQVKYYRLSEENRVKYGVKRVR